MIGTWQDKQDVIRQAVESQPAEIHKSENRFDTRRLYDVFGSNNEK